MAYDESQLPNVVRDAMRPQEGEENNALNALSRRLCELRNDVVKYRADSGIEQIWLDCEEAYLGIDDENRHEYVGSTWQKSTSMSGPITSNARINSSNGVKSTAFVKLTARYVDAGAAKLGEILLPIDGKAFKATASPKPEMIEMQDSNKQVMLNGQPALRDPKPEEVAPPNAPAMPAAGASPEGAPQQPAPVPLTYADLAQEALDKANEKAKAAETRIHDWMVQSKFPAETRKSIFDRARLGTGILKGPFPEQITRHATVQIDGKSTYKKHVEINPSVKWVDPWNFYPDDSCGENIHDGDYVFERDMLSPRKVKELKKNSVYIAEQIDAVLAEGPQRIGMRNEKEQSLDKAKMKDQRYEVWYYYGMVSREEMGACKGHGMKLGDNGEDVSAIVTMINDRAVRATVNLLDSGRFPYHAAPWCRRIGSWAGVGVAEQVRMPQRMTNSATRALLVNAAKTAGAQIVVDKSCIEPADGKWTLTPDKIWYKAQSATTDDVNKAFAVFNFPNVQKEMMGIIEYGFKLAEESCSIPLVSQGQSGKTMPDTFGATALQDSNANQLLRAVGYSHDDYITEPLVSMYYEWLLLDPKVPNDEKGDWNFDCHGSAALVERAIQNSVINSLLQASLQPAYGADTYDTYAEFLRSQRLDPARFQMPRDEFDKRAQTPPPPDPVIEAAKIRADATLKASQSRDQVGLEKVKMDTDRDTKYVQAETERTRNEYKLRIEEATIKRDALKVKLASDVRNDQLKRDLANAEIRLAEQQSMFDRTHDRMKHDNDQTLKVNSIQPNSLTRDEVSTNITP